MLKVGQSWIVSKLHIQVYLILDLLKHAMCVDICLITSGDKADTVLVMSWTAPKLLLSLLKVSVIYDQFLVSDLNTDHSMIISCCFTSAYTYDKTLYLSAYKYLNSTHLSVSGNTTAMKAVES